MGDKCFCGADVDRDIGVTRSGSSQTVLACSMDHAELLAARVPHARIWRGASLSPEYTSGMFPAWKDGAR
jgi:hypothetical protein